MPRTLMRIKPARARHVRADAVLVGLCAAVRVPSGKAVAVGMGAALRGRLDRLLPRDRDMTIPETVSRASFRSRSASFFDGLMRAAQQPRTRRPIEVHHPPREVTSPAVVLRGRATSPEVVVIELPLTAIRAHRKASPRNGFVELDRNRRPSRLRNPSSRRSSCAPGSGSGLVEVARHSVKKLRQQVDGLVGEELRLRGLFSSFRQLSITIR